MFYDKKIRYLDYFEGGTRVRGAGYVKLEERDGGLRMELAVTGLHPTDSFSRDVFLHTTDGEKEIGKITISGGRGQYRQQWSRPEEISGSGYGTIGGIRIPLGSGREISCIWRENREAERGTGPDSAELKQAEGRREAEPSELMRTGTEPAAAAELQMGVDRTVKESSEELRVLSGRGEEDRDDAKRIAGKRSEAAMQQIPEARQRRSSILQLVRPQNETETPGRLPEEERNQPVQEEAREARRKLQEHRKKSSGQVKLLEDKWSQLWAIYPHVRPFRDGREYLSIGPADFVLFSSDSYRQVNNSFLLHGYYNYDHLILTRMEKGGEKLYYIGVPGTYFEREKQVAIMFGFESFECAEEPAQTGDFGYYMMRTVL